MKIALVHRRFDTIGGTERYCVNLAAQLIKMGHEVHVFANGYNNGLIHGLVLHHVPMAKITQTLKVLSFAWNSQRIVRQHKFDIVQGFGKTYPQDCIRAGGGLHGSWQRNSLLLTPNPFKRRWVDVFRKLSLLQVTVLALERKAYCYNKSIHVIAPSKITRDEIIAQYGIPEHRINVIPNGVDLTMFNPEDASKNRSVFRRKFSIKDTDFCLLFVATNLRLKGFDSVIEALKILLDRQLRAFASGPVLPGIKLLVGGTNRDRYYEQRVRQLSLQNMIVHAGKLNDEGLLACYGAADAFVYPTYYDPFSNVCLEAMACGLPVITSRHNGISDIIEDGVNGLLVNDPSGVRDLAERVGKLFDPEYRTKLAENALCTARIYSMERHVDEVLKVYEKIIAERGRGR
jgi:UDP-glucose:(heptosyl)LPS alpha-1,3-glucosyltransferase